MVVALLLVVILGVALVLGVADGVSAQGTHTGSNGSSFEAAPALVADQAAHGSSAKGSDHSALLGVWTGRAGGNGNNGKDGEGDLFHKDVGDSC